MEWDGSVSVALSRQVAFVRVNLRVNFRSRAVITRVHVLQVQSILVLLAPPNVT